MLVMLGVVLLRVTTPMMSCWIGYSTLWGKRTLKWLLERRRSLPWDHPKLSASARRRHRLPISQKSAKCTPVESSKIFWPFWLIYSHFIGSIGNPNTSSLSSWLNWVRAVPWTETTNSSSRAVSSRNKWRMSYVGTSRNTSRATLAAPPTVRYIFIHVQVFLL